MDIFTQNRWLIRISVLMLVFNLIMLGFLIKSNFFHSDKEPNPKIRAQEVLKKELHLTQDQEKQLQDLRMGFYEKESILKNQIKQLRDSMNEIMYHPIEQDSMVCQIARQIAEKEYLMEMSRFEQSKALKKICSPDQILLFEKLVKEIRDFFKPEGKPKPL